MTEARGLDIAIVDYGMGNLFSVAHALARVGLPAFVTSSSKEILKADAVVLPGVGAFGHAMSALGRLDLVSPLRDVAASERVLVGICLGMQLLMTESEEFGVHRGLDIFEGPVVRLHPHAGLPERLKVPHVGWSRIYKDGKSHSPTNSATPNGQWNASPLNGLRDAEFMYFVHSFYAVPEDAGLAASYSRYGDIEFCSSLWRSNVFACQFHPERSGQQGLNIYRNLASIISGASENELSHV